MQPSHKYKSQVIKILPRKFHFWIILVAIPLLIIGNVIVSIGWPADLPKIGWTIILASVFIACVVGVSSVRWLHDNGYAHEGCLTEKIKEVNLK